LGVAFYPSVNQAIHHKNSQGNNSIFWNVVFFANNIPMALSMVYKEMQFSSIEMDVWYLQAWDQVFMTLFTLPALPLAFVIPPRVSPASLPTAIKYGMKCLLGENTYNSGCHLPANVTLSSTAQCRHLSNASFSSLSSLSSLSSSFDLLAHHNVSSHHHHGGAPPLQCCDHCSNTWLTLLVYLSMNLLYNISALLVIKHGSATLFSLANTVRLPLANLAFAIPFIMGVWVEKVQIEDVIALILVLFGIAVFRFIPAYLALKESKEKPSEEREEEDDEERPRLFIGGLALEIAPVQPPNASAKQRTNIRHMRRNFYNKLGLDVPPPPSAVINEVP